MAILCRSLETVTLACFAALSVQHANAQTCGPLQPSWTTRGLPVSREIAFDPLRSVTGGFWQLRGGAQTVEWDGDAWSAKGAAPNGVTGPVAFDPIRQRVIWLGQGNSPTSETWEWSGASWQRVATVGPSPTNSPRLLTDTVRGRVICVCGGSYSQPLSETWEWNGSLWTLRATFTRPSGWAMAFDPIRGRTVLFGGLAVPFPMDTLEWDGTTWQTMATTGPARTGHTMVFDSQRGRVILFGGVQAGYVFPTDGWEWTGSAWAQLPQSAVPPSPFVGGPFPHNIVNDTIRQRMVAVPATTYATWERRGALWTQRTATNTPPSTNPTDPSPLAWDPIRRRAACIYPDSGTSEWGGLEWAQRPSTHLPTTRTGTALAASPGVSLGNVLLFGGVNASQFYFSDTWTWDGTDWSQALPSAAPPARSEHAMAFDSTRNQTVLFGGRDSVSRLGDTWEWDGSTWQQGAGSGPSPRKATAMAFDSGRGRTILFGGDTGAGLTADTWEWDGSNWTRRTPAHSPPARHLHAMAYDAGRGRTLLLGGIDINTITLGDFWEWDGTDWIQQVLPVGPLPRARAALFYDSARSRPTLFGGMAANGDLLNDTWTFSVSPAPCCASAGPGHTTGGLTLACGSQPLVGGAFCMSFPSALNVGLLIGDAGTCTSQPITVDPPALCQQGFIYPSPVVILFFAGNPAQPCLSIPQDPVLPGQAFCFQALALQPGFCFLATNALSVRIGAP